MPVPVSQGSNRYFFFFIQLGYINGIGFKIEDYFERVRGVIALESKILIWDDLRFLRLGYCRCGSFH